MKILNERPDGMSFPEYKGHLKEQKIWLKQKRQGRPLTKEEEEKRNQKQS